VATRAARIAGIQILRTLIMSLTNIQQADAIRAMARRRMPHWLKWILALTALLLGIAGLYTQQTPYFIGFLCMAIIAYSAHHSAPHIDAAAQALDTGDRIAGTVTIEISRWSDADTYHASVAMAEADVWRFEFIPIGWHPVAGQYPATFFRSQGLAWPALIQIEAGIMYPRNTPKLEGK
jgi:hypothetical protein